MHAYMRVYNIERISVVINRICFRGIGQIRNLADMEAKKNNYAEFHQVLRICMSNEREDWM